MFGIAARYGSFMARHLSGGQFGAVGSGPVFPLRAIFTIPPLAVPQALRWALLLPA
jgi:hypothetical protein